MCLTLGFAPQHSACSYLNVLATIFLSWVWHSYWFQFKQITEYICQGRQCKNFVRSFHCGFGNLIFTLMLAGHHQLFPRDTRSTFWNDTFILLFVLLILILMRNIWIILSVSAPPPNSWEWWIKLESPGQHLRNLAELFRKQHYWSRIHRR